MMLIGLAGPAGTGKDTVGDYLVERHGFTKFSFSDALYREVSAAFDVPIADLQDREKKEKPHDSLYTWGCTDAGFQKVMLAKLVEAGHKFPTEVACSPRQVLQWWGTEYRRAQNPDYWIDKAALWVQAWLDVTAEDADAPHRAGLVNTSVRFENERAFIERLNGMVWHLRRGNVEGVASELHHVAEAGLEVRPTDRLILNNGTVAHLHTAASLMLRSGPGAVIDASPSDPEEPAEAPVSSVTCMHCGWVHMAYTRAAAQTEVDLFNTWFKDQPAEVQANYGGRGADITDYEGCKRCGQRAFRKTREGDCPDGSTITPVICEDAQA